MQVFWNSRKKIYNLQLHSLVFINLPLVINLRVCQLQPNLTKRRLDTEFPHFLLKLVSGYRRSQIYKDYFSKSHNSFPYSLNQYKTPKPKTGQLASLHTQLWMSHSCCHLPSQAGRKHKGQLVTQSHSRRKDIIDFSIGIHALLAHISTTFNGKNLFIWFLSISWMISIDNTM